MIRSAFGSQRAAPGREGHQRRQEDLGGHRGGALALGPAVVEVTAEQRPAHRVGQRARLVAEAPQGDGPLHRRGHGDDRAGDDHPEGEARLDELEEVLVHDGSEVRR
jgi:hypothetical protein